MISYKSETPSALADHSSGRVDMVLTSVLMARTDLVDRHKAGEILKVTPRQVLRYVDMGWLTQHRSPSGRVRYSKHELRRIPQLKARKAACEPFIPTQRAC